MGYLTSDDHEALVVRSKDVPDNATPSGGAMATMVLMKLAAYTGHPGYVDAAEAAVAPLQPALAQAPTGFAWWLCALNFELAPPKETAIVGENAQALFDVVFGEYRPNQVVAYTPAPVRICRCLYSATVRRLGERRRRMCVKFACQMPVTEAEGLAKQLM